MGQKVPLGRVSSSEVLSVALSKHVRLGCLLANGALKSLGRLSYNGAQNLYGRLSHRGRTGAAAA